ncbi:NAD(P)-dependent alcohol dehydrogenase [Actinoplanes sp. NPDC051633]|uniref:NAD(P)-dependent alcohol dehydrogenase n=1 Tax=Actinoplanes sp. NPDC051633 TaxID=3155670 RepID=UPI003439E72F
MKAVTQDRYGSYDVLECREVERPAPGPGEVLLQVAAAGVDPGVWHLMTGLPMAARLVFGLRRPKDPVRGRDVAGTIVATGPDSPLSIGDQVFGISRGSFAEFAIATTELLVRRPANVTAAQAAVTPISGGTALQAVEKGEVAAGHRVLVIGAGGGVGTFAVQLAKARGAEVTGVCSAGKADLVRSVGADHVIDYNREGIGRGYDVIIDIAGLRTLGELRGALSARGTVVMVGGEDDGRWVGGGLTRGLRGSVISPFVGHRLRSLLALERREDLVTLAGMLGDGTLTPVIDRTYALAEAPAAIRDVMEGRAQGKLVVIP